MAWFRISFAEKAFLRLLASRGLTVESMSIDEGVSAMLEFYRSHRAQHTTLDEDGDGLLFQWSPGRLDVTRQMVRSGDQDNPVMQLSVTFVVDAALPAAGSEWHFDPAEAIVVPSFFTGAPQGAALAYEAA